MIRKATLDDIEMIEDTYNEHFIHEFEHGAFTVFKKDIYPLALETFFQVNFTFLAVEAAFSPVTSEMSGTGISVVFSLIFPTIPVFPPVFSVVPIFSSVFFSLSSVVSSFFVNFSISAIISSAVLGPNVRLCILLF